MPPHSPRLRTFTKCASPGQRPPGLAMAYGSAKQSGGGISIHSQPGQGTTVLDGAAFGQPLSRKPCGSDEPLPHGGELVLLVEDETERRRVVRRSRSTSATRSSKPKTASRRWPWTTRSSTSPSCQRHRRRAASMAASWQRPCFDRRPAMRIVPMSGYTDETDAGDGRPATCPCWPSPLPARTCPMPRSAGEAGGCMRTVSG